jgi:hypothetical protein
MVGWFGNVLVAVPTIGGDDQSQGGIQADQPVIGRACAGANSRCRSPRYSFRTTA